MLGSAACTINISTHALREEGDKIALVRFALSFYFYPRPPRGGRRQKFTSKGWKRLFLPTPSARRATSGYSRVLISRPFLPTPSARRATRPSRWTRSSGSYFYPRPPRGGRRTHQTRRDHNHTISTHALREEGDRPPVGAGERGKISTHALREEGDAYHPVHLPPKCAISTHALREEGDRSRRRDRRRWRDFYPRPPRGGRRANAVWGAYLARFLPTPSARRATVLERNTTA